MFNDISRINPAKAPANMCLMILGLMPVPVSLLMISYLNQDQNQYCGDRTGYGGPSVRQTEQFHAEQLLRDEYEEQDDVDEKVASMTFALMSGRLTPYIWEI